MIIHVKNNENILDSNTEAIVNTVNCVGVMGAGLALCFKNKYPKMFSEYRLRCLKNEIKIGEVMVYDVLSMDLPHYIINFPTKKHWKENSLISYIDSGLISLLHEILKHNIKSVSIPPLGCGLGGLKWQEVLPKIEQTFLNYSEIEVKIYHPIQ